MTEEQKKQFNRMANILRNLADDLTPKQVKKVTKASGMKRKRFFKIMLTGYQHEAARTMKGVKNV